MVVTAKLRYLRIAPRKVRLVADLLRGKSVEEAQNILNFTQKRVALPILKLLKQGISNAKNNFQMEEKNLYISKILVDEGPKLKRVFPRARGHADEIQKKTSHITIILDIISQKQPISERGRVRSREFSAKRKLPTENLQVLPSRKTGRPKADRQTTTRPPPSQASLGPLPRVSGDYNPPTTLPPKAGPSRARSEAKPSASHQNFGGGMRASD